MHMRLSSWIIWEFFVVVVVDKGDILKDHDLKLDG